MSHLKQIIIDIEKQEARELALKLNDLREALEHIDFNIKLRSSSGDPYICVPSSYVRIDDLETLYDTEDPYDPDDILTTLENADWKECLDEIIKILSNPQEEIIYD